MSSERVIAQGHLREKEIDAQELKIKIQGLRDSIRIKLDQFIEIEHLAGDVVVQQALELEQARIQYLECLNTIGAIKRALGIK